MTVSFEYFCLKFFRNLNNPTLATELTFCSLCFMVMYVTLSNFFVCNRLKFSRIYNHLASCTTAYIYTSQLMRDIPGTSPESSLKILTFGTSRGTFRGLLGDQHENWWFNEKCFLDVIALVLHIYYYFLLQKQIFKRSKWGRSRDVYGTQLRDVPGTKWWDVLGRSVGNRSYIFFKFDSEIYQTYFDRLLKTL